MVLKPSMMAAATMASAPSTTLAMFLAAGAFELAEEQAAPEDADEGVGVPQGEGDGEADVANGEDGEGVGDGPQHAGEDGDEDEVLVVGEVGEDVARAFEQGGDGPARGEDAGDHAERDGEGREAGVDELGGRFRRAEPDAGTEPAEHAEAMGRGEACGCIRLRRLAHLRRDVLSAGVVMAATGRDVAQRINGG